MPVCGTDSLWFPGSLLSWLSAMSDSATLHSKRRYNDNAKTKTKTKTKTNTKINDIAIHYNNTHDLKYDLHESRINFNDFDFEHISTNNHTSEISNSDLNSDSPDSLPNANTNSNTVSGSIGVSGIDSCKNNNSIKKYSIYTLTNLNNYITKFLIFVKLLKIRKVKIKTKKNRGKGRFRNNKVKKRKKNLNVDTNSIKFKFLNSDKSKLPKFSKNELSKHILSNSNKINQNSEIWMLIHGFIFDISKILRNHPGGPECLLDCAGVDATKVFDDVGHSDIAWEMLQNCCVGIIDDFEHPSPSSALSVDSYSVQDFKNYKKIVIWNKKSLEFSYFVLSAIFGLLCFIFLQRKKWHDWVVN